MNELLKNIQEFQSKVLCFLMSFWLLNFAPNLLRIRPIYYQAVLQRMSQVSNEKVYEKAEEYWSSVASDVDGMLGGFEKLHRPDIDDSKKFIYKLKSTVSFLLFLYMKHVFRVI